MSPTGWRTARSHVLVRYRCARASPLAAFFLRVLRGSVSGGPRAQSGVCTRAWGICLRGLGSRANSPLRVPCGRTARYAALRCKCEWPVRGWPSGGLRLPRSHGFAPRFSAVDMLWVGRVVECVEDLPLDRITLGAVSWWSITCPAAAVGGLLLCSLAPSVGGCPGRVAL